MSRKSDVPDLSGLLRFNQCLNGALLGEDAVWIVLPQDFVELNEIDSIGLQPRQRLFELRPGGLLGPTVDFSHQKCFFSISALGQRVSHPLFTVPVTVVPRVVEKVDTSIERRMNQFNSRILRHGFATQVRAAKADQRHALAGLTQRPKQHTAAALAGIGDS
jgi:hypothetical protein